MTSNEQKIPRVVRIGTKVEIELLDQLGRVEKMLVSIVADTSADFSAGYLGSGTPLARALLDQPSGKTIPYRVGDLQAVRILSIKDSTDQPSENAAEKREASIRKAVAEVDRTNAVLFASSFSGKWGDYDPEGIEHWESSQVNDANALDKESSDNTS